MEIQMALTVILLVFVSLSSGKSHIYLFCFVLFSIRDQI